MILGIDEVGRGSWAGPLVVGAVVLGGVNIGGLTDSKKLSKKRREALDIKIREKASAFGLGWVGAEKIDKLGLSMALKHAAKDAIKQINVPYNEIIIDGTVNYLSDLIVDKPITTMKKADLLIPSVSAASIIAKVARDKYMMQQNINYPGYNFDRHAGYGTGSHRNAIKKLGINNLHRLSFKPLNKYSLGGKIESNVITSKQTGDNAEDIACKYLVSKGYKIIDRNWKTKYCEIDIVSQKNDTLYFVEVKYRKKSNQSGGLATITTKKLRQMKFATKLYVSSNNISNMNLRLAVITLHNNPPIVDDYLEV